jgi:oligopeptide transport system substrate-binding protein
VSIVALLAGCGGRERPVESGMRDKVLHIGNGPEPQDLDPHTITGAVERRIVSALIEGIVTENPRTLEPEPGIADTWNVSDNGLIHTFHIREAARWSNGEPIIAPDIVESFHRMLTPSLGAEYSYMLHHVAGAEEFNAGRLTDFSKVGFEARDDRTLVITLRHPTPFLLKAMANHYAWWPVNVRAIARIGDPFRRGAPWTRPANYVGSGPFVLKAWLPNQKVVVEKSPTYWDRDNVGLNGIEFHTTESVETMERMFRTGQLHVTTRLPVSKTDAYRRDQPEALHIDPQLASYFFRFNVTRAPFNDPRVRRALALAINRESIVANVTHGGETPSYGIVPPGILGYESRHRLEGTLDEAKLLLAEAGFPEGKGFPRKELLFVTSENNRVIAEAIQQMWKQNLGIDVVLANQEWKVYLDSQDTLDYDIGVSIWGGDYVDPHTFLEQWVTGGGNNDSGWSSLRYDKLLADSLAAGDTAARYEVYQEMERIMIDELPIIPIFFVSRVSLRDPAVKGYYPTVLDLHPWKYVHLEK